MSPRPAHVCEYEGCQRRHSAKGYCQMHLARLRRNGGPGIKRRARGVMDAPVVPVRLAATTKPIPKRRPLLSPREARLVLLLARADGRAVSHESLENALGLPLLGLQRMVCHIRSKTGYRAIETIYGEGYALPLAVVEAMR